jgi:hypothetical protein
MFGDNLVSSAAPYYEIFLGETGKPFSSNTKITQMLQSKIISLTITRKKYDPKNAQARLAEATITLREPLDNTFFAGLPGADLQPTDAKFVKGLRIAIEVGYKNIKPQDLMLSGHYYYPGKFLKKGKIKQAPALMRTSALVFIGKFATPSLAGDDKGVFSSTIQLVDTMSLPFSVYDPVNSKKTGSQFDLAFTKEMDLNNKSMKRAAQSVAGNMRSNAKAAARQTKPIPFTVSIEDITRGIRPEQLSPLFLIRKVYESLFGNPSGALSIDGQDSEFELDDLALFGDPRYTIALTDTKINKITYEPSKQNRYSFFTKLLTDLGLECTLHFNLRGKIVITVFQKGGNESKIIPVGAPPSALLAPPNSTVYALNAIYGINITSFDYGVDSGGASPGGAGVIAVPAGDSKSGFTDQLIYQFDQDKMNKWTTDRKAEFDRKGISGTDNTIEVNKIVLDMQSRAGSDEAGLKEVLDAWYRPVPITDKAIPSQPDVPKLGQSLKLKWRYAIPGMLPGMSIHFDGLPLGAPLVSFFQTPKSTGLPDPVTGRYRIDSVRFSFQNNAVFTMETECSR